MHKIRFTITLFHASTCFQHMCASSGQNWDYTASGIITPIGGRLVHSLWERTGGNAFQPVLSRNLCTRRHRWYQRLCNAILSSWWWAMCKNIYRHKINLLNKKKFCAASWLIAKINILRCTVSKTSKKTLKRLKPHPKQNSVTSRKTLNPTGHVMHQQFNIQQLYALPTPYLCVLYLS